MSEHEIRRLLREFCADLDARVWGAARKIVVPGVVGATLALSGCDSEGENTPLYMAPADTLSVDASDVTDTGPAPLYAAPTDTLPLMDAVYGTPDTGPEDVPSVPLYAAPDDAQALDDASADTDGGVQILYGVPDDVGPGADTTAADDVPFVPLYAAPYDVQAADDASKDVDGGVQVLYGVPDPR